jgi:hypothetical protein
VILPLKQTQELEALKPNLRNKEQLNTIITNKDGSPDYLAINIYYDSLRSWYNPKKLYKEDGNILHIRKLKTQGIYYSAEQLSKKHGCSKETVRKKLVKLENLSLIQRSYEHKSTATTDSYNHRCIFVWKETPYFYNHYGLERNQIKNLKPQTNAKYIENKHGVVFGLQNQLLQENGAKGGIHTLEDTKELRELISKDIRSNTQARESISCNNSSFVNSKETNSPTETKELVSEKECCFENTGSNQQTSVIETKVGKFRPNKRRKKTNSEIKLKKAKLLLELKPQKAKIIRPVFYPKPKSLADMNSLLDQEIYDDLRSGSGRDFSNNFIAQRLLAMSKKPNLASTNFKTRKGFVAYMSLVLKYELYDVVKTCGIDFRLRANLTVEDRYAQEQERFLAGIENSTFITPEWQFKKKLVSVLSPCKAYKLLQSYICLEIKNNVLRIQLTESVELSELEKEVILDQVKAVYENTSGEDIVFIEKLEFVVTKDKTLRASVATMPQSNDRPESNLPQGIWGEVCKKLIAEYGVHVYRNWFSKLNAEVDEVAKTVTLKAINDLTKDWISSNYQDMISSITSIAGFKLSKIEC